MSLSRSLLWLLKKILNCFLLLILTTSSLSLSEDKVDLSVSLSSFKLINSVGKETVVGHLPENIAKLCFLFLKVPFTSIKAEVTGKRVNRGGGFGLEVPVIYYFSGPRKHIDWTKEKLKIRMENLEKKKTKKCLK